MSDPKPAAPADWLNAWREAVDPFGMLDACQRVQQAWLHTPKALNEQLRGIGLTEVAEGVIMRHRENLGAAFRIAVNDHRWSEAAHLGETIIAEWGSLSRTRCSKPWASCRARNRAVVNRGTSRTLCSSAMATNWASAAASTR